MHFVGGIRSFDDSHTERLGLIAKGEERPAEQEFLNGVSLASREGDVCALCLLSFRVSGKDYLLCASPAI